MDWTIFNGFNFKTDHNETSRYIGKFDKGKFDYYVPKILLDVSTTGRKFNSIRVTIGRSPFPATVAGFKGVKQLKLLTGKFMEFDYFEERSNSFLYNHKFNNIDYKLYLPKLILEELNPPQKIYTEVV